MKEEEYTNILDAVDVLKRYLEDGDVHKDTMVWYAFEAVQNYINKTKGIQNSLYNS